ncbi:MAG: TRL-like family protein [Candidatus Margulisbacteria bacterium]|nr:TRL-like family protein [Candidatus Margulisiibacteriota bacterium]
MLKKLLIASLIIIGLANYALAAPSGALLTIVSEPVAATSLDGYNKSGESRSFGLCGLLAFGDASTNAAAKQGDISAIHHVDRGYICVLLGLFVMETTMVYGK